MGGIGVVTNPHSRRNRRQPHLVERLAYILGDRDRLAQPRDRAGMEDVARRFMERDIDVLCINGGDGTGHVVLSAFAAVYGQRPLPMLALLRGGTMNTVAHGLGIKGKPSELLDRVVSKYHEGKPFQLAERNLLCVDGRHYGFMFGNGFISNFLALYYEARDPSPASAMALLGRSLSSAMVGGSLVKRLLRPLEAQVSLDGETWPAVDYIALAAGTVDDLGFGFRPFWAAPDNPGKVHCLGFNCPPGAVVAELYRFYRGLPTKNPAIFDQLAHEMRIEANCPLDYMVDGDFHHGGQVLVLRAGPRVRFIVS